MSAPAETFDPIADGPPASVLGIMRRGWRASPELRDGIGITILLASVGAAGRVVIPVLVQQVIDKGFNDGKVDVARVVSLSVAGAVIAVVATVCTMFAARRLARSGEHALFGLRTRAFRHIHRLSIAHHAEERRGALVSRVTSDVETLSQFFKWGGIAWVVNGLVIVAVLITMFVFNWKLALVALCTSAPLPFLLRVLQKRLIAAYDILRIRVAELLTAVSEVVMGAAVIRSYGTTESTTAHIGEAIEAERRAGVKASTLNALMFPSGELFAVLTVSAVVIVGVVMGPASGLTAGELVGFMLLVNRFLEPVAEVTEILDETQTAVSGWRRVLDLLDTPIDIVEPDPGEVLPPGPPSITVDHVSFSYRPRPGSNEIPEPALRDVSVVIDPGTSVAVVGATGSGKTTFAKLLTRLADPTEGRILISGVDLRDVERTSLRSSLVMVPQDAFLFDTTIADNVRFGRPGADADGVRLAFVELGLEAWVDSLADGLETRVGERGEHLSVGERQLVALARAYVANPVCLILDEATSAVDAAIEARLARAVESLARGRTSVTIAHRLSTAERSDVVLVFDQGRLVERGSHHELLAHGGVYARLHASWLDATASHAAAS